jgi:hypothetical protein
MIAKVNAKYFWSSGGRFLIEASESSRFSRHVPISLRSGFGAAAQVKGPAKIPVATTLIARRPMLLLAKFNVIMTNT